MVWGDRGLLQRCVANLLDNALTHTPLGTGISVSLHELGGQAMLIFSDDGLGVPPEEHVRIFQRFVGLDRSRSTAGYGLGLNMVAAIMEAHQGSARAVPTNNGLTVELRLPTSKTV